MGTRDGQALYIYSIVNMVLGILEGVLLLGEIVCEVFSIGATFLAFSGPACIGKFLSPNEVFIVTELDR